jgi:RNA polymerase sigma-70 factor, ECF subfamily
MVNQAVMEQPEATIDDQLVARFRAGETRAFDELAALHMNRLFAIAFEALRQREDAEEVTQEVLLTLYRELSRSHTPLRLRSWLYRVCINACIDRKRAGRRQPLILGLSDFTESLSVAGPAEQTNATGLRDSLRSAVAELPDRQRLAFTLCHFAELSVLEIAETLQCAPATVRVHLSRATAHLREVLSKEETTDERL